MASCRFPSPPPAAPFSRERFLGAASAADDGASSSHSPSCLAFCMQLVAVAEPTYWSAVKSAKERNGSGAAIRLRVEAAKGEIVKKYITHALCIPKQCAFVCEGHVLERCVALGRKLGHLQLLPHQSTKGLIVSTRSRCVYAWLWRHPSLNNAWSSTCLGASFYQNGAAKIHTQHAVLRSPHATSGKQRRREKELQSELAFQKQSQSPVQFSPFYGWFTRRLYRAAVAFGLELRHPASCNSVVLSSFRNDFVLGLPAL